MGTVDGEKSIIPNGREGSKEKAKVESLDFQVDLRRALATFLTMTGHGIVYDLRPGVCQTQCCYPAKATGP